jgi:integrase
MAELLDLLDAEGPTRLATAAYIALLAGLRVGEVCALTWADFDGECLSVSKSIANDGGGSLREKTPKTDAGEREVPVPPRLRDALERRKQYQLDRIEEAGIGVSIDGVHIVGGCDGSTMNPSAMSARWRKFARRNGIKGASGRRATFHDLRDSFGTALLAAGVDVKTSASLMGHGDGGVTLLRHYATATNHAKKLAAQKLAKSLEDGTERRRAS